MKKVPLLFLIPFFLFNVHAQTWSEQAKIVGTERFDGDKFGASVSIWDKYAIVGAEDQTFDSGASFEDGGAVYFYERNSSGTWVEKQKLVASDRNIDPRLNFGVSVSIHENYAIVGAYAGDLDASGGNPMVDAGSAYIFERNATGTWREIQKIVASDRGGNDWFGWSVDIDGNYAIVGARRDRDDQTGQNPLVWAGSAYIFKRNSSGNWSEVKKISAIHRSENDEFGGSVSISGDHILIGSFRDEEDPTGGNPVSDAGSAYIFEKDGNDNWSLAQKIVADDRTGLADFGSAVSIDGDQLIVGASHDSRDSQGGNPVTFAGSAYIFEKDGSGTWTQQQKIVASDRSSLGFFGFSVSMDDEHTIIGSYRRNHATAGPEAGSAYIFEKNTNGVWSEKQKIISSDIEARDWFGISVAICGNYSFVGAQFEDHDASRGNFVEDAGSAYIFELSPGLSITQNDFGSSLQAFPNPTHGKMTIALGQTCHDIHIKVRNAMGQMIYSRKIDTSDKIEMEIKGSAGLYFMEIQSLEGKSAMLKVVKE